MLRLRRLLVEERGKRDATLACSRQFQDLGQTNAPWSGGGDQGVRPDDPRGLADAELGIEDDAERLAHLLAVEAGGELWIVRDHGVDPDEDRVVLVTEAMRVEP